MHSEIGCLTLLMPQNLGLNDPLLLNEWFPVAWTSSLPENKLQPMRMLGHDLVLWRSNGSVHAWKDLCIHRGAKLSLGKISQTEKGVCVVCPYHGWEYNPAGECVRIPAHPEQPPPSRARAETFAVREKYGLVWVCLRKPAGDIPAFAKPTFERFRRTRHSAQYFDPDAAPIDIDWSDAVLVIPARKKAISIRVDEDVLDYFKREGDGYQRRINAVLRSYMQQKAKPKKRA